MDEHLIFYAWWVDYEEGGWVIICEKDGKYYCQEGGHSVMCETETSNKWNPEPISEEEALALMLEWAEDEDTDLSSVNEILVGLEVVRI